MKFADRLHTVEEYYFSKKLREVRKLASEGKDIINMGIGSPDMPPPKAVTEAIVKSLTHPNAHKYQNYKGLPEFRQAIADFYKKHYEVILNSDNEILPLMGSKEGILHISLTMLNQGDKVLVPNPGYPTYSSVTKLVGGQVVYYGLDKEHDFQPNFEQLEQSNLSDVKLMWVNYPHMPTGAKLQRETFKKLIDFGKKHSILIVNDNPYSFILNDNPQSILKTEGAKDIALELNSLSKTFNMAGWRVGMLAGKSEYLDKILKVKTQQDSGMFYGTQKGAVAALQTPNEWLKFINTEYSERRKLMWEFIKKLNCTFNKDNCGMFIWAKIPKGKNATKMVDDLLYNYAIFVAPGIVFGSNGKDYLRFSLCVPQNKITEAIQRI